MFCGVLRVFCGCFAVFCEWFPKNSVLRCFAAFCGCFAMFWTCFANVFCGHFLSERKTHSTVLRCIAQSVFCSFCAFCTFLWSVLCCFVKNTLKTRTQNTAKHRKTPQNTAKHCILKNRDPLRGYVTPPVIRNLRVLRIVYFCARSKVVLKITPNARNTYYGCNATVL